MKKFLYSFLFAMVATAAISSCTEDNVKPRGDGGTGSSDPCQFGGPGCKN